MSELDDDLEETLYTMAERQRALKEEDIPEIKQEIEENNKHLNELNGQVKDHASLLQPFSESDTKQLSRISKALNNIKYGIFVLGGLWVLSQSNAFMNFVQEIEILTWMLKFL